MDMKKTNIAIVVIITVFAASVGLITLWNGNGNPETEEA